MLKGKKRHNPLKTYSIGQVAKMLNVSISTIATYCRSGKIKATKVSYSGGGGFKYVIEGDDFLKLIADFPISRGPRSPGERLGPFRIIRLTNGDLVTERV